MSDANFTPSWKDTVAQEHPFKFWAQMNLPAVYDDSLSYYEQLCRIVNTINTIVANNDSVIENNANLLKAYNQLQSYVNDYFNDLDIDQEINEKLDEMAKDGTLSELIKNILPDTYPEIVTAQNQMTDHAQIYLLTTTNTLWYWKDNAFVDSGIPYGEYRNGIVPATSNPTDANDMEANRIYAYYNAGSAPANSPDSRWLGDIVTVGRSVDTKSGQAQIAISRAGEIQTRAAWGANGSYTQWNTPMWMGNHYDGEITFTEANQAISLNIPYQAGTLMRIYVYGLTSGSLLVYADLSASGYEVYNSSDNYLDYVGVYTGNITLFNRNFTGKISYDVYTGEYYFKDDIKTAIASSASKEYHIGEGQEYQSITKCFNELKNDKSNKTIYIHGGDYDIYQEYQDENIPVPQPSIDVKTNFYPYNVYVPPNTHVIGLGNVNINWLADDGISNNQMNAVSPVNVLGSCIIENVTINCKNGRYCIHGDALGNVNYSGSRWIFKGVKCYRQENKTGSNFAATIGFGLDEKQYLEFDNCYFENDGTGRAFYVHSRTNNSLNQPITEANSSTVLVRNSEINTTNDLLCTSLGVSQGCVARIDIKFENTWFSGQLRINDEGSYTSGDRANVYNLTLLNCKFSPNPTLTYIEIRDTNNKYPPKLYNTETNLGNLGYMSTYYTATTNANTLQESGYYFCNNKMQNTPNTSVSYNILVLNAYTTANLAGGTAANKTISQICFPWSSSGTIAIRRGIFQTDTGAISWTSWINI